MPYLVKKIKGFPLKVTSFRNTATYQKLSPPPRCTPVGVSICVYVRGLSLVAFTRLAQSKSKTEVTQEDDVLLPFFLAPFIFSFELFLYETQRKTNQIYTA